MLPSGKQELLNLETTLWMKGCGSWLRKAFTFLSLQYLKHFHVTNRSSFNFSGNEMKFLALLSKCFLST